MNRILLGLPALERDRLLRRFERVNLDFGDVLYEAGNRVTHAYFPVTALVSLLTVVDLRRTLEVGMVGREGMAGMPLVLGVTHSAGGALVQGAGEALRMDARSFRIELSRSAALRDRLSRYTFALIAQISQTAACNRFHGAEPRLARWLMMTRDRVDSDEFRLTHVLLAHMLGLRREGVTEAASALRRRGLITYARGKIRIADVRGLKAASCSCYRALERTSKRE
ncbi:MAG: Crp/Fnr family transcriptional regulator [Rhodanobacteraceae bacterium]